MEITDEQKACKVIEVIVSDDFCEDIEFSIAMNRPVTLSQKDIALINKKFCTIYRLTHAANKHSCEASHEDWAKELSCTYKRLLRKGEIEKPIPK